MCKTNDLTVPQEKNAFLVFTTTAVCTVAHLTVFSVRFHRPAVATRVLERVGNQPTLVCRHAALGVLGEGGGGEADGVDTHRPSHHLHQEPHQQRLTAPLPLCALPHAGVANGQLATTALGDWRWVGRQVDDWRWVGRHVDDRLWVSRQVDNRQWVGRQVDARHWMSRQVDDRQWAGGQVDDRQWAGRQVEGRHNHRQHSDI